MGDLHGQSLESWYLEITVVVEVLRRILQLSCPMVTGFRAQVKKSRWVEERVFGTHSQI